VKDTPRFGAMAGRSSASAASSPATMIPHAANCYTCHEANTAVDRTFVQFYPTCCRSPGPRAR
jgi:hypothetical protein